MNRSTPFLWLLLALPALAQEPADTVTLLLEGGASVTGRLVRVEEHGVRLRRDLGGEVLERLWTWDLIDDADPFERARATPPAGFVAGVEVQEGEHTFRGVVVSRSADLLVIRDRQGNHRFDPSRVRIREVLLAEGEVLDEARIGGSLAGGATTATAADHPRAATEAACLGRDREANDLLRIAEVLSELGRPDQEALWRIGLLRVHSPEEEADVREMRRHVLDQAYEEALRVLDRMRARNREHGMVLDALRNELTALRCLPVEVRIVLWYDTELAKSLWGLARDGSLSWSTASAYVRGELAAEVRQRTADRFSIDVETARTTYDRRPADRQAVVSWGSGSFLAAAGVSEADREAWWARATPEERYAPLRALAAEVCGQVLSVVTKDCAGCGGRGESDGTRCDRCAGHRRERVVIYR